MHLYKTPQNNALLERIQQVIYIMFVTKYIDRIVYNYIGPWGGNLASFTWAIRSSYYHTLGFTPGQSVCGRNMLFKLMSSVDWRIIIARRLWKEVVYNVQESSRQFRHDYIIGDLDYVENTGIYRKSDYKKQSPYIITEYFTHGTVQFQRVSKN